MLTLSEANASVLRQPTWRQTQACRTCRIRVSASVADFRYNGNMENMPRKLLFLQLFILVPLAALHFAGLAFYLYWYFPWFDVITHAMGGMWAGAFLSWARAQAGYAPRLLFVVGGVLVIGVVWEIFEVAAGLPREANYVFDTGLDLLMDVLGSLFAFGIVRSFTR